MKVVATTDEYTVYQKRSERYAVRDNNRKWVNGDAKVAILLKHELIAAPAVKAPEPVEVAAPEEVEAEAAPAEGESA